VINRQGSCTEKTSTLYDAGGWFLMSIFFGALFIGLVLDYFWNYLIFSLSLWRLHFGVSTPKKYIYCLIITGLGLFIDWLYYELTWGYLVLGSLKVAPIFATPGMHPVLEFATILIPMAILGVVNFAISHRYLHMSSRPAIILGIIMGIFTAPWLIVVYVLTSAW
jgi:hypothetical protein